ncbi:DUF6233 domain-containing protein [Streptomyces sp. NPDC002896]|uniref:DUF6233 domain-containing protein n=1 Tax=Streptomyces sp. NPDC002896 TaxID=3154438 RepID=UPI00332606A2
MLSHTERSPSRLDQLRFLERVQVADLERTRRWIAQEERRLAEVRRQEQARPPTAEWVLQESLGAQPVAVHVGGCHMAGERIRGITREQALHARVEGVDGCGYCGVDAELGYLDG